MDLADMADYEIEEEIKLRLSQQAQKSSMAKSAGYALTCELCNEPIPPERHKLLSSCSTCVECANMLEHANRIQGKDQGVWWY